MEEERKHPWSWPELVGVFLLGFAGPALASQVLAHTGFFAWQYGQEVVDLALARGSPPGADLARARLGLWAVILALPLQLAGAIGLMRACGATLAQMGVTWDGAGRQAMASLALGLVLMPAVWGVHALTMWACGPAEDHVFTKLARAGLSRGEWALLVFAACVAAPLWEELFYRGLVQPWAMESRPEGGLTCLAAALAVAVAVRAELIWGASSLAALAMALVPALAVLAAALPFAALRRRPAGGLWAAAVFFAFIHASVWPTPVPLLLLALGLGWLRARWGSLTGPVLLHAIFNAVACTALALQAAKGW
jgi:membrane protease YdiL (CAAX protease family)